VFDQILVPVDGSLLAENILPHTIAMAKAFNSEITLINVLDPLTGSSAVQPIDPWDWQMRQAEVKTYLDGLTSHFQTSGLNVRTLRLEGKAPDCVLQHSNSVGMNLIMLSSHGQGGISGWNSSSVVTKIIQQARTSVMIIRSYTPPEHSQPDRLYRRILVPVDGSRRAEYGVSAAAQLAREHGAELLIAQVIKPPELPRRMPLSEAERSLVWQVVESNLEEANHYLSTLKASQDCKAETRLLIEDSVTEALHSLVEQEEIDLVVLNAHGLGGSPRWPFGNVTLNFLTYGTIALLIVQDFDRALLEETKAESYAKDFLGQPTKILDEAQQNYHESKTRLGKGRDNWKHDYDRPAWKLELS
jgi:nucleotide-binding universal stress UspA family protein